MVKKLKKICKKCKNIENSYNNFCTKCGSILEIYEEENKIKNSKPLKNKKTLILIFSIVICIVIAAVVFLSMDEANEKHQSTKYEINTVSELCINLERIYSGSTYKDYRHKIESLRDNPDAFFGPYSIGKSLETEFIKNVMWNYKINPELSYVWEKHARNLEYLDCNSNP